MDSRRYISIDYVG